MKCPELVFPTTFSFWSKPRAGHWLHFGPGEASSPYVWDLGPKRQEESGGIAARMVDPGGREGDIILR